MKNLKRSTQKTRFAGIDCSSATLVASALFANKPQRRDFPNDAAGHRQLIAWLGKRSARVCIEATGMYHLDACVAMHKAGIEVMVLNPRGTHNYQRARNVRAKTDKIDADGLLDYLLRQQFRAWVPPALPRLQLRQITRRMAQIIDQISRESNRMRAARASVFTPKAVLSDMNKAIGQQQDRLKALQKEALELVNADPWLKESFELLRTCKGIAERSALLLLGELSVLPEDMSARQWVAHAGLDPRPRESGKRSGSQALPRHISRQGNARIRAALYMPALVAVRWNGPVKAHYQHLISKGKAKLSALVAIMRKLLHAVWAILHHRTNFDAQRFSQYGLEEESPQIAA